MTDSIKCDTLVFQTLEDLKDACIEAADEKSEVKDFEVGVFCGKYTTPVPPEYFERSKKEVGSKKRKATSMTGEGGADAVIVASSPMNVRVPKDERNGDEPDYREDIRYVE